jgi:hypothetical protein
MLDTRIILSGLWVATMLTYLWGDVLRIMAGHTTPGRPSADIPGTPQVWLMIAAIMLVPIIMVVLSLILPYSGGPLDQHHRGHRRPDLQCHQPALRGRLRQFPHRRQLRVQPDGDLVRMALGALSTAPGRQRWIPFDNDGNRCFCRAGSSPHRNARHSAGNRMRISEPCCFLQCANPFGGLEPALRRSDRPFSLGRQPGQMRFPGLGTARFLAPATGPA